MESTAAHEDGGGAVTRYDPLTPADVADLVLGLASVGAEVAVRAAERVRPPALVTRALAGLVTGPVTATVSRLADRALQADWSQDVLRSGRSRRRDLNRRTLEVARRVAAAVVEVALDLVDVTDVVIDHVDLDAVVRAVDLDRAVERVDVDAVVRRVDVGAILERVDVDEVVARADLDRAVARVDVGAILERVDVDEVVARVDVGAIIDRVDIDAIAARLDLDAVVARLDLVALAEYVVEGIDLPGIIQSSSGAMASESLREVRWQGVSADERVAHVVDRMLHRRPRTPGPALPSAEAPVRPVIPGTTV
ncbi:hypothetical protein GCM10009868_18560 [Terrabacter aerolatus]|uniref:Uncharacterized protein n=1 Tax=Terrabacter aerolatus TaxID=422442 RepID=A0A512CZT4_9MICO|nr:hypothetical protein [Terrabacter aerolatus]GEO29727.1 hypothetical protein TAE01_15370 [Terrabacter aerolatus]